jgi:precorrin-2 methylase
MGVDRRMGTLYGIGVGPGDPELLTVKAYRVLKAAPVIAYPKKRRGDRSYAQGIVEAYVNPAEKTMLGLVFPMTKDPDVLRWEWDKTAQLIASHLSEGRHDCVVFLKGAKVLDQMLDVLAELGLTNRAAVVCKATSAEERIWRDVESLRGAELNYLTLMVVRK